MPYTMTSPERVNAAIEAARYVSDNGIGGAVVECGVWKGGSALAMMMAFKALDDETRDFYLYDTYTGMSAPSEADVSIRGDRAQDTFNELKTAEDESDWCLSPLEEVKQVISASGYDESRIHYVKGKVEETIPGTMPEEISVLRLDTDWYESTKHELIHLFPLLKEAGVLIIDDYGHWQGSRQAVDEYMQEHGVRMLLNRIDYTGRMGVKT